MQRLCTLKVGDEAAVAWRSDHVGSKTHHRIVKITKVTPKFLWVGKAQYSRETGWSRNDEARGVLTIATPEIYAEIQSLADQRTQAAINHKLTALYCIGLFQGEWSISEADDPSELDGLGYTEIVGPIVGQTAAQEEADRRNREMEQLV